MFSANVPTYTIDLATDEAQHWTEVISREKDIAGKLIAEAGAEFERVPELLRWVFARAYQRTGGLYVGDLTIMFDVF